MLHLGENGTYMPATLELNKHYKAGYYYRSGNSALYYICAVRIATLIDLIDKIINCIETVISLCLLSYI